MIHDDKVDGISGLGPINIFSLNQQVPTGSSAHSLRRNHKYDLLDCSTGAPFSSLEITNDFLCPMTIAMGV